MEKTLIGYIVFVSYNRDRYELNNIALDDMTFREFIDFLPNDEVNCLSIELTRIYDTTPMICGGSYEGDDSVYWFISPEMAKMEEYSDFFCV